MTSLREHFADLADQAKQYDVTEAVVRRTRRRRLQHLAPAAVAVLVLVGTVAWVSAAGGPPRTPEPGTGPVPVVDAAGPARRGSVPWLPERWQVPAAVPMLPADRGVGEAALAFCVEASSVYGIVLRDGTVLRVPGEVSSLSPDGRWLVYGPEGQLRLRDLAGTAELPLGAVRPVGWSPDGARVALEPAVPGAGNPDRVEVLEPATGRSQSIPVHDRDLWAPVMLMSAGDLLLSPRRDRQEPTRPSPGSTPGHTPAVAPPTWGPGERPGVQLAVADGRTGAQRALQVAAPPEPDVIGAGPGMAVGEIHDGGSLLIQLAHRTGETDDWSSYAPADLIEVSAGSGALLRRVRLPEPVPYGPRLLMVTSGPRGVLLVRSEDGAPSELELLDPDTGDRVIVSTLPDGIAVLPPGARGYTS